MLASLVALSAGAEPEEDLRYGDGGRWVPSFAIAPGVLGHQRKAEVESACERGGPANETFGTLSCWNPDQDQPFQLRPPDSGDDIPVDAYIGGLLELSTPVLSAIPGGPRLFVRGELLWLFPSERDVAKEGEPSGIGPPINPDAQPPAPRNNDEFPMAALVGAGSETQSTFQDHAFAAAAGIAFPIRYRERWIWIKPSAGWMRFGLDVEGRVTSGLKNDPIPPVPGSGVFGEFIREIELESSTSEVYDAIGGGLEVELQTGKFGPIGSSLFIGVNAYRVLGDTEIELSQTVSLTGDGIGDDTYTARWSHEIDPWIFRGGLGMRFSWLGN